MNDPLFDRTQLAIEESGRLRHQRKLLLDEYEHRIAALKQSIFESAMVRVEMKAHRDNRE